MTQPGTPKCTSPVPEAGPKASQPRPNCGVASLLITTLRGGGGDTWSKGVKLKGTAPGFGSHSEELCGTISMEKKLGVAVPLKMRCNSRSLT